MAKLLIVGLILLFTSVFSFADTSIPGQNEFTNHGIAINHGDSWDRRLEGAISPSSVIKKGNAYYLYYIGADGARGDGGPAHRKLGVATSTDGIKFTKHSGNPILTYNPGGASSSCNEEGIFSAAAMIDDEGTVLLYYGGMQGCGGTVHTSIRLATSQDGLNFQDRGVVIPYNSGCSGCGDEIMPLAVFKTNSRYYVYYNNQNWNFYLATLSDRNSVIGTETVISGGDEIRGGDGIIEGPEDEIILILGRYDGSTAEITVRNDTISDPNDFNNVLQTWNFFPTYEHLSIYRDASIGKWFLYALDAANQEIHVLSAPGNISPSEIDPPAAPTGLEVLSQN